MDKKIVKPDFNKQMEPYRENLLKLLDQEEEWFIRRVEAAKVGDWERVKEIEGIYLIPLNRKVKQLVERAPEL